MENSPAAGKFSLRPALRREVQLWEKPAAAMLFAWLVYALHRAGMAHYRQFDPQKPG